ncbi:MAG: hypothetical protein AAFS07_10390 [Pseudomonadota bacterium]
MEIDWLTTAAQLVNFFVLVWLLRRFLFRPVSEAIETRRAEIADALAEAETRERAADEARDSFEADRAELAASAAARLAAADAEAAQHAAKLRAEAEAAENRARTAFAAALEEERASVRGALQVEVGRAGIEIARRVLADLADETLEALLVRRLTDELGRLEASAPMQGDETLAATLTIRWPRHEDEAAVVECLNGELSRLFGRPTTLELRAEPEAGIGAVLEAGGLHAAWTLDGHIDRILERFERQSAGETTAVAGP